jgi:membrane-bound metal-dependent hydrolase YbcI (DUF457 family)
MTYKTHTMMSLAVAFAPLAILPLNINNLPFYLASVSFFSLFPDLDEKNSYLSYKFPFLSMFLRLFTEHRGLTHRFFFSLIVFPIIYLAFYVLYPLKDPLLFYFAWIGYISHLIGDGFTKGGLKRFFYPFSKKTFYFLPYYLRFKTNSFIEKIYFTFFLIFFLIEVFFLLKSGQIKNILLTYN